MTGKRDCTLARRGLSRIEAATYVGISPCKFDQLIADGRMPIPRRIDQRKVWDVPSSQRLYRIALDCVMERDGHRLVRDLPPDKARKVIQEIGIRHPAMASLTRSVLRRLFAYAVDIGLRRDNPFSGVPSYKLGTHHTWSDVELEAFEKRWPLGTRQRLAYAILLYTGQRVGDAVRMRRSDIRKGTIHVIQQKTGVE